MEKEKIIGSGSRRVYTNSWPAVMRARKLGLNPRKAWNTSCYVWEIEIPDSRTINLLSSLAGWQANKLK